MSYLEKPEQDTQGDGFQLPSYEDLAAQKGPNSRFGRWKEWVEKRLNIGFRQLRAAERYTYLTEEEVARRRQRSWGDGIEHTSEGSGSHGCLIDEQCSLDVPQSFNKDISDFGGESLDPTHLKLHVFGSRFIPHTTSQIRCLLPILKGRLLLIGHDDGLSVLNMFPTENTKALGLREVKTRVVWEGEGVHQLKLLEYEDIGDGTPQGVILALVKSDLELLPSKESGINGELRMYNLGSIISLARWVTEHQSWQPLDLRKPKGWSSQKGSAKRYLHNPNFTKIVTKSGSGLYISDEQIPPSNPSSPSVSQKHNSRSMSSRVSTGGTSAWDVIEDLALRWATDYVPLATQGSRLSNSPVIAFEVWKGNEFSKDSRMLLAVVIKSCILLYESLRGQRAFKFVKEFYTPVSARNLAFVRQLDCTRPHTSNAYGHRMSYGAGSTGEQNRAAFPSLSHSSQLNLFVVFEKKAGLIRLADSAVGEVGQLDDYSKESVSTSSRSLRISSEAFGEYKESKTPWLLPIEVAILNYQHISARSVYLITKGKKTHIVPSPLPTSLVDYYPLANIDWSYPLRSICYKLFYSEGSCPSLQVVGFGEYGIEIQEIPFDTLFGKNDNKVRACEPIRLQVDVGESGFLSHGRLWHDSFEHDIEESIHSQFENGIYAWCREAYEDWRIYWIGQASLN